MKKNIFDIIGAKRQIQIVDPSEIRKFTSEQYNDHLKKLDIRKPVENRCIFSGLRDIHDYIGESMLVPGQYVVLEGIKVPGKIMFNLLNVGSTNTTADNVKSTNNMYGLRDRLTKVKSTAFGRRKKDLYTAIKKAMADGVDPKNIRYMYVKCNDARFNIDNEIRLTRKFKPVYNTGISKEV